ncbi:MAG TPA: membrane dipeptidase [Longimicrobiales bacterium]|nr:membrane dipeptidase [Longimicrobiales bacterium]
MSATRREFMADVRRMKWEGKAGLLLAAQDGDWVGYELSRLQAFHDAGLRMMLLAYNANNVEGFNDYAEIVGVAERLLARGYSDDDVHAIQGENFLRVFEEVFG